MVIRKVDFVFWSFKRQKNKEFYLKIWRLCISETKVISNFGKRLLLAHSKGLVNRLDTSWNYYIYFIWSLDFIVNFWFGISRSKILQLLVLFSKKQKEKYNYSEYTALSLFFVADLFGDRIWKAKVFESSFAPIPNASKLYVYVPSF